MKKVVNRSCQHIKYETGKLCRSGKKTKAYRVMIDKTAFTLPGYIRAYLCPKCAEEVACK
jgi:hypothetical protein